MPNYEQDKQMPEGAEMEIEIAVGQAEMDDEAMYAEMAPRATNRPFSRKALNNLVKATNRLLPLFGQDPTYPEFDEDIQVFPTDFVRVLAMFQGAANEAVDTDILDMEMDMLMEDITDDQAVNMLAGKLTQLAQSKEFKRFLTEAMEEPEGMEMEEPMEGETAPAGSMEPEEMAQDEIDNLFANRM